MAEIGVPERRRVLIPQTIPAEPNPYAEPPRTFPPEKEPAFVPERVPA